MAEPYIGEIRVFGFSFAPRGYMFCNGQILPIQQYAALFSILGTTYGGNGTTNFGLPNFTNSAAMDAGQGQGLTQRELGEVLGTASVTLTTQEIPNHTHLVTSANTTTAADKTGTPSSTAYSGPSAPANAYILNGTPNANFSPRMISNAGSNLPHPNVQPMLAVNFCIAVEGAFPSRN